MPVLADRPAVLPAATCQRHSQVRPDYLFVSSWNEGIAQPQTVASSVPPGFSMGLESDANARPVNSPTGSGFVDTYGLAFGRDVEPSAVRLLVVRGVKDDNVPH